jgi:ferric iron reductase protein FhuF
MARATHPLTATLDRVAPLADSELVFGATLGAPDGPGWHPATALARGGPALDGALSAFRAALGTPRADVAASLWLEAYVAALAGPAVALLVLDARLPDLDAAQVAVRLDEEARPDRIALVEGRFLALADDPAAADPRAVALGDDAALASVLHAALVAHLGPLVRALQDRSGRPGRALWRSATDVVAGAFLFGGEVLGLREAGMAWGRRVVGGPAPLHGPPGYEVQVHHGIALPMRVREGCCLGWRVPGARTCTTCPLTTDAERAGRLSARAERRLATP